ncbi:hypothetical protein [Staphylococcus ratti]|uniref:Phage protein n=1 Tax=Staphylococcus ratti TaxID=2892440 RepID=A0ABY3PBM0_9STAP|nr:hypothetical protein [Staphylococcus ratti]UEX89696.1 hypothetical protein LN051_09005 [Staphylococcus ratti]
MDFKVSVKVDADEAIEKLERIKALYKEINDLQNERPIVNIKVKNEADIPAIKTYIEEENTKNIDFSLM